MKRIVSCLLLLFVSLSLFGQKGPRTSEPATAETFTERSATAFDAGAYLNDRALLHQWLVSERAPGVELAPVVIEPSAEDIATLTGGECEDCGDNGGKKVLVGVTLDAGIGVDFSNLSKASLAGGPRPLAQGVARLASDGGVVWTLRLASPGATAIRIQFGGVHLPPDGELYVYNDAGDAFGPYTDEGPAANGEFWSDTLFGDSGYIQFRFWGPDIEKSARNLSFEIVDIAFLGPKFVLPALQDESQYEAFCAFNAPCVEDASCHTGVSQVVDARDAVAHIQFVSGPFVYICSGGLLTDTDPGSQIPLFLTANHCISSASEANSMQAFFQFATSSCGGPCYNPVGVVPTTNGATILATGSTSDYTLMQLSQPAPAGSAFMGWSTTAVANTNGADLYRISHPSGAPQAFSQHDVDTSAPTCGGWPRGPWIYSRDVVGATEGGSSGSPVLNDNGQVVGQLTGACGFNVNDPCDAVLNATVDGAFANYYNNVEQWLDPQPGGNDTMHVHSITLQVRQRGNRAMAIAKVQVRDNNGNRVPNATVTGTFSGDVSGTNSAVTNGRGVATIRSQIVSSISNYMFCVNNITHATFTYEPNDNVVTCDNYP